MKLSLVIAAIVLVETAHGKVTITKLEPCDPNADTPIKMTAKLKEENGMQVIEEGSLKNTIPIGNDIMVMADVFIRENDKYEFLITLKESYCDTISKYLGEFGYGLQKASGLEPGTCPIPPGDYAIKNHPLNFSTFKLKKIPHGDFQVTIHLMNPKNESVNCLNVNFSFN